MSIERQGGMLDAWSSAPCPNDPPCPHRGIYHDVDECTVADCGCHAAAAGDDPNG